MPEGLSYVPPEAKISAEQVFERASINRLNEEREDADATAEAAQASREAMKKLDKKFGSDDFTKNN